jgi:hypothetical protein
MAWLSWTHIVGSLSNAALFGFDANVLHMPELHALVCTPYAAKPQRGRD